MRHTLRRCSNSSTTVRRPQPSSSPKPRPPRRLTTLLVAAASASFLPNHLPLPQTTSLQRRLRPRPGRKHPSVSEHKLPPVPTQPPSVVRRPSASSPTSPTNTVAKHPPPAPPTTLPWAPLSSAAYARSTVLPRPRSTAVLHQPASLPRAVASTFGSSSPPAATSPRGSSTRQGKQSFSELVLWKPELDCRSDTHHSSTRSMVRMPMDKIMHL